MLGGLFGNQGTLFRVEIAEIFSPAKDETQKALEFSLPLDPEVLEQFEAELFQVPGDLLAYRLQWQEDWYEYELIPQPEGLSEAVEQNLFRDPVIRIYEGDGRRAFLRYREGGFEVESSEGSKEMVAIRHYDIVINQQGDLSDPEGVLEEYKKDIETLLATHFDREYRKQHPW